MALRLSQQKTLAALVGAALRVGRVSLAALGRQLTGKGLAKHRTKRAWRVCANERVVGSDAMQGVARRLRKRRQKKPLVVAFDWTDLRTFHTLMAAAVLKGRAGPLLGASYTTWKLDRSQNNLEEGLLRLLRPPVRESVTVILLADRGFGRTELARTCQQLGFRYLVRIKPDVWVEGRDCRGNLADYPVKQGMRRVLKNVRYRQGDPVTQPVVIRGKEGLPKKRDEPGFLLTDLGRAAVALTNLYAKRMTGEELLRDDTSQRNGFALRQVQLTKPARVGRRLLILALAYWLLVGIGLRAQQRYRPGKWCSTNSKKRGAVQCSAFTIGRIMLDRMKVAADAAVTAVVQATADAAPNWG
jgi:hypothetical protein